MTLRKSFKAVICSLLAILLLNTSCTGKKENAPSDTEEKMVLTARDTASVRKLMDGYFDLLMKKDFTAAKAMVYQLYGDSLGQMDPEISKHYDTAMKLFSPIRYEIESMFFEEETDCLVRYSGVLFEKDETTANRQNKVFYAVRPVRLNGEWYLTVADNADQNTRRTKIRQ